MTDRVVALTQIEGKRFVRMAKARGLHAREHLSYLKSQMKFSPNVLQIQIGFRHIPHNPNEIVLGKL